VANCTVSFGQTGLVLNVTNNIVVDAGGSLGLGTYNGVSNCTLNCGGSLILTNGGGLVIYSAATGGTFNSYGALVAVSNDLIVGAGSWVQPISHWTNGGAALFRVGNLVVETNGGFNARARGYTSDIGPGTGVNNGYSDAGGSHGGRGGSGPVNNNHLSKNAYGSVSQPVNSGSGGATYNYASTWPFLPKGSAGGGVIRIEATNAVTVRGALNATGGKSYFSIGAGGAGGSIYIKCRTFGGTADGLLAADGGDAYPSAGLSVLGGGGGGRIAVDYENVDTEHAVRFTTRRAAVDWADFSDKLWKFRAQPGTLWLKDTALLTETLDGQFNDVHIFGIANWSPASLTVSNCWVSFAEDQGQVTVTGDIRVDTNGSLGIGMLALGTNYFLRCGGNLIVTNGGALHLFAGMTNNPAPTNYGALLAVTNSILVNASSRIYAYSHSINGGSPFILADNIVIETGGEINANNRGFTSAYGPGTLVGGYNGSGGGYGGRGGYCGTNGGQANYAGGATYGSPDIPIDAGSGANGHSGHRLAGGSGGGVIRLQVADTLTLRGSLLADGGSSTNSLTGGGSGGGIYVACGVLDGVGAVIRANGGIGMYAHNAAGGGGRIALDYQQLGANRDFCISTAPGAVHWAYDRMDTFWRYQPRMGTLSLPDPELLPTTLSGGLVDNTILYFTKTNSWNVSSLTVTNCTLSFGRPNFILTVTNDLVVGANANFGIGGDPGGSNWVLACGGNVLLTNGGYLTVYAGLTNGTTNAWCALVSVTNDLIVASGSWIRPEAHETYGGSPLFRVNNLLVGPNAGFNADSKGFGSQYGPGKGGNGTGGAGGGGHGGRGGDGASGSGGGVYDATNGPLQAGSGGGSYDAAGYLIRGGLGGGVVRVDAAGAISLDGTITAKGSTPVYFYSGGGAGGSIHLACSAFSGGPGAVMQADGSNSWDTTTGGGGGGRIAVWRGVADDIRWPALANNASALSNLTIGTVFPNYTGLMTVNNGAGRTNNPAQPGTMRFIRMIAGATRWIEIHGKPNDLCGAPQPFGYGTHEDIPINTWITNSVASPADEAAGTRHACVGWDLKDDLGALIASDPGTQAVFQVTTNLALTWNWTNEYLLAVSYATPTNGSVNSGAVNGWYTNGVQVSGILATASNGWIFSQWTGDVPPGNATDNPLTLTMDQPRTVTPVFIPFVIYTKTWTGFGNWTNGANWDPAGMPSALDNAIVGGSSTVLVSQVTYAGSLVLTNGATLIFTNWTTKLYIAGDIAILSNGLMTLPAAFSNNCMSNRINFACSNLTIESFGQINADAKGYAAWSGPGRGVHETYGNGGGYGGRGGKSTSMNEVPGQPYGSVSAPLDPGSGGGSYADNRPDLYAQGGSGGGAIRIEAGGTVTVNGTVTANGGAGTGSYGAGGSGGSIYITCNTFGGTTNGILRVNGGNGLNNYLTGGGGGGRIAVAYQALAPARAARFSAMSAAIETGTQDLTNRWRVAAQMGTLWLPDMGLLSATMGDWLFKDVNLTISNVTAWTVDSLVVTNCSFVLANNGFQVTVSNNLVIGAGGSLAIGAYQNAGEGFALNCGGLVLTNGGTLYVYSGLTNSTWTNYGFLVSVTNDIVIGASSRFYVRSHGTNGGAPLLTAANVTIETNGMLDAIGGGFAGRYGPGVPAYFGTYVAGSGYGGKGGTGSDPYWGGPAYGSVSAPNLPGSGGPTHYAHLYAGGLGGGLIRMLVTDTVTIRGTITADGGAGLDACGGGGSGGGIYIRCHAFGGTGDGLISVRGGETLGGGASINGGGGGGRIALDYQALAAPHGVRFSAAIPSASWAYYDPDNLWQHFPQAGTLWLPDTRLLSGTLTGGAFDRIRLYLPTNAWAVNSLLVSNAAVTFAGSGFQLTVTNDIVIAGGGALGIGDDPSGSNYALTCGGNLTLTTGSVFYVYAGLTNAASTNYGTLAAIGGRMTVGDGAWVYPVAQPTNGGTVLFRAGALSIGVNAGFNANAKGYFSQTGPGKGVGVYYASGGGFGGHGGEGASYGGGAIPPAGPAYGSTNEPVTPGSGGGHHPDGGYYSRGGLGGGAVRLEIAGEVIFNGSMMANGGRGLVAGNTGAGAGGGILVVCQDFKPGPGSLLTANGGEITGNGGGGGGGRIAVWRNVTDADRARIRAGLPPLNASITNDFAAKYPQLTFTVNAGAGYASTNPAQPGTVVFVNGIIPGSLFMVW
jgi:hypothetical protein